MKVQGTTKFLALVLHSAHSLKNPEMAGPSLLLIRHKFLPQKIHFAHINYLNRLRSEWMNAA
jgi:hypothetical protein